jgi:hypothetical protein
MHRASVAVGSRAPRDIHAVVGLSDGQALPPWIGLMAETYKRTKLITSLFLERGNPELQDRVEVLSLGERLVLIVADGAGGIGGGTQAAERFVRGARQSAPSLASADDCAELLRWLDEEISDVVTAVVEEGRNNAE